MEEKIYISAQQLTLSNIEKVCTGNVKYELSEESRQLTQKCRDYLDKKMQTQEEPIYGITTGFGSLQNRTISKSELSKLQENLIISHACGVGQEIQEDIVRLMLFLKAYALSLGKSAVQVKTIQRILDFLNERIYPVVYELGSLGASGDLAPLAHLFLPLIGQGEVYYKGGKYPAGKILKKFGWEPITLQSKEGLALLNGTQFMTACGVYMLLRALKLIDLADIIAAISLDAYDGRMDTFFEKIHEVRPHAGQVHVAKNFRTLLEGSELQKQHKQHVQDPYSFRCIPQVHGASRDTVNYVKSVILTEINSISDNPLVFPDDDIIISGGNFHGQPLALAFDFLCIAMAEMGNISERRLYRLISGQRGLPEFLIANPGLNSGFMIPQYTSAAIVSRNKQLCSPASVDSIPSSNEQEDHVSMGANAATKALQVVNNLEQVLAIELFAAAQALEFRRPLKTSMALESFVGEFRKEVSFIGNDKLLYPEMSRAKEFLRNIKFTIE